MTDTKTQNSERAGVRSTGPVRPKNGQMCIIVDDYGDKVKAIYCAHQLPPNGAFSVEHELLGYRDWEPV